jgi:hypothetical protein
MIETAGDHITFHEDANGTATFQFSEKPNARRCGDCQLCCKLLPVVELAKPAGHRCHFQRSGKGCTIYQRRPGACRFWACRGRPDKAETEGVPRPDRAHYVIDVMPDYVRMTEKETGEVRDVGVVQVWVDQAFRDAWDTPTMRAFMLRQAVEKGLATIIRYTEREAITVFPPPFDVATGEWHIIRDGEIVSRTEHEYAVLAQSSVKP